MTPLSITPDLGRNPWTDIRITDVGSQSGRIERIGLLPNGTDAGRPTIAIVGRLSNGQPVILETTWALMRNAVRALDASSVAEADRKAHPNG